MSYVPPVEKVLRTSFSCIREGEPEKLSRELSGSYQLSLYPDNSKISETGWNMHKYPQFLALSTPIAHGTDFSIGS